MKPATQAIACSASTSELRSSTASTSRDPPGTLVMPGDVDRRQVRPAPPRRSTQTAASRATGTASGAGDPAAERRATGARSSGAASARVSRHAPDQHQSLTFTPPHRQAGSADEPARVGARGGVESRPGVLSRRWARGSSRRASRASRRACPARPPGAAAGSPLPPTEAQVPVVELILAAIGAVGGDGGGIAAGLAGRDRVERRLRDAVLLGRCEGGFARLAAGLTALALALETLLVDLDRPVQALLGLVEQLELGLRAVTGVDAWNAGRLCGDRGDAGKRQGRDQLVS